MEKYRETVVCTHWGNYRVSATAGKVKTVTPVSTDSNPSVMAEAVDIPVFASSLLQVPVVSRVMGKNKKVGIITVDAEFLTQENLSRVGIDESIPHIVYGLERSGLFVSEIEPAERLKALEGVLVPTATKMVKDNPEVAAIVYECTLLPPTSAAVQAATGLPVFDVITLIKWAYSAVVQKKFDGFM
jgi:hypothetical protein